MHVIKPEEKRPAGLLPLDDVFEHTRSILVQKKTGQYVGQLVEELVQRATVVNLVETPDTAASPQ